MIPTVEAIEAFAQEQCISIDAEDFYDHHRWDDNWKSSLVKLTHRDVICPRCGHQAKREHDNIYICAQCEPLSQFDVYFRFQYPADTRADIVDTYKMLDEIKRSIEYGAYNNNASNVA